MAKMTLATCAQCSAVVSPEDAVYDDVQAQYYCNVGCFRDWADDNFEAVTEFYERMNVN